MRLLIWLTDNKISHRSFARMIGGVTTEAVRLWAAGKRMPETRLILRIEEVTGGQVTVRDLHEARVEQLAEAAQ